MAAAAPKGTLLRSIGAVFAGLIVIIIGSTLIDEALVMLGVFPPIETSSHFTTTQYAIALRHRIVVSIFGSWLTARLAPHHPMAHALILGGIGAALGLTGAIVMWSLGDHWYPIALVLAALPCAWLGGKLRGA